MTIASAGGRTVQSLGAIGTQFSERILPALRKAGIVEDVDLPAFELMAFAYSLAWQAAQHLQSTPLTRRDENGIERKSPWLQILRDFSASYRQWSAEFFLTPAARVGQQLDQNLPVEELFGKTGGGDSSWNNLG